MKILGSSLWGGIWSEAGEGKWVLVHPILFPAPYQRSAGQRIPGEETAFILPLSGALGGHRGANVTGSTLIGKKRTAAGSVLVMGEAQGPAQAED